jgi:hypothetical protein
LQGRELTLANIRSVLKTVTRGGIDRRGQERAAVGRRRGAADQSLQRHGRGAAAGRRSQSQALQQFADQGANLQEGRMKSALADLEKMEDVFFATVTKAAQTAGAPLQGRGRRCSRR